MVQPLKRKRKELPHMYAFVVILTGGFMCILSEDWNYLLMSTLEWVKQKYTYNPINRTPHYLFSNDKSWYQIKEPIFSKRDIAKSYISFLAASKPSTLFYPLSYFPSSRKRLGTADQGSQTLDSPSILLELKLCRHFYHYFCRF